jgi:hypothetical protein
MFFSLSVSHSIFSPTSVIKKFVIDATPAALLDLSARSLSFRFFAFGAGQSRQGRSERRPGLAKPGCAFCFVLIVHSAGLPSAFDMFPHVVGAVTARGVF